MEVEEMSAAKDFLDELELFGKSWNYMYGTRVTLRNFARCVMKNLYNWDKCTSSFIGPIL